MARVYDAEGADELIFLDITASSGRPRDDVRRGPPHGRAGLHPADRRRRSAQRTTTSTGCCVPARTRSASTPPRSPARADRRDRRAVRPAGARAVLDARRCPPGTSTDSGFEVTTHGGRRGTGLDAVEWVGRARSSVPAKILLNSMDADGTRAGYDLELIAAVRSRGGRAGDRQRWRRCARGLRARGRRLGPTRCSRPASSTSASCGSATSRRRLPPPASRPLSTSGADRLPSASSSERVVVALQAATSRVVAPRRRPSA